MFECPGCGATTPGCCTCPERRARLMAEREEAIRTYRAMMDYLCGPESARVGPGYYAGCVKGERR
jgi:hypothetical protein